MTVTKRHQEAKSEFGKGLIICLVKFAEHAEYWLKQKDDYDEMGKFHPALFNESRAVEMFFSGASDHLYKIEVPKEWENTKIARKVKELQNFGLMIGHGFTGRQHSERDVEFAYNLCEEIALLIDKKLGLDADIGQW